MFNPWVALAVVGLGLGAAATGYKLGREAAEGAHALQRQQDIERAYKAGAADLDAESKRAQAAQRQRDALAAQLRSIDHENPVPPRPDRRWTDAEFRLLESRRAAHAGADREPGAGPLPGAVPGDAEDGPRPAEDHHQPAGLGLRLPGAAAGVPGLGSTST